jgi:DNA-binding transcriptional MerR regulator
VKIGELARRTAVSERSLRYYEAQGLLAAERTPAGHRTYPERAVDRVIRIQELFAAGLCSVKIAGLLPCIRDEDGGPSETATPSLVADLTSGAGQARPGPRSACQPGPPPAAQPPNSVSSSKR